MARAAKDPTILLRTLAMQLPGVTEGTSYGTLAFKVGGKLFARLREDGETLVVYVPPVDQEFLLRGEPDLFYITDHYRGYPIVLVRLRVVPRAILKERLTESWRQRASPRLRKEFDSSTS